jgi:hypothetical protein
MMRCNDEIDWKREILYITWFSTHLIFFMYGTARPRVISTDLGTGPNRQIVGFDMTRSMASSRANFLLFYWLQGHRWVKHPRDDHGDDRKPRWLVNGGPRWSVNEGPRWISKWGMGFMTYGGDRIYKSWFSHLE